MNLRQRKYDPSAKTGQAPLENENGAVLVVVLILLLLLTILGTSVLTSTTTEIRMEGNIRNQQQAFFTAQGALEIAPIADAVVSAMSNVGDPPWTGNINLNARPIVITAGGTLGAIANTPNTAHVEAAFVASGTAPRGSGSSADVFVANYYDVNVVGVGPNNSEVEIASEVYKLQAKTD